MARLLGPKCRHERRIGERLQLKGERCTSPKCAVVRRSYPPGIHGPKKMPRLTEYGRELREKQKAKLLYGILESQFRRYVDLAMRKKGDPNENLLVALELRLDNIVYRLGLTKSRSIARQFVSHGHILVNERRVNIPSLSLKTGDTIQVSPRSQSLFTNLTENSQKQNREIPSWLEFSHEQLTGKVLTLPPLEEIKQNIDPKFIIEFYSR